MKAILLKCIFAGIVALTGVMTRVFYKKHKIGKPDNQIEEVGEYLIAHITGVDTDLSPDTPDKDVDIEEGLKEIWDAVALSEDDKPVEIEEEK